MRERDKEEIKFSIAGHSNTVLWFDPRMTWCGSIADGVSFQHGEQGCWVVRFKDLEAAYLAAKKERE